MHPLIILGSTGNLGQQALEVLDRYPDEFKIQALTGYKNTELLAQQAQKYRAEAHTHTDLTFNKDHIVLNLLSGTAGIEPTKKALKQGAKVLLANKESIVAAGAEIMPLAAPGQLIPVDSEHNAIYEILLSRPQKQVQSITLPCSGGPFLGRTDIGQLTAKDALQHPKWSMGPKVSIESALLINKGLEIIEAHYLFDLPIDRIKVKIHPECQIHGLVTFTDGETLAYISQPDMREHLENALLRTINQQPQSRIQPFKPSQYQLQDPDHHSFPGIQLVLQAFQQGRIKEWLEQEEKAVQDLLSSSKTIAQLLAQLI